MNYLVDTHLFLWVIFSPQKISKKVKDILLNGETIKYISVVTFWEISLKYQLKKIALKGVYPDQLPKVAKDSGFELLNLEFEVASSFYKLPKLNGKDPFDRILVWQAISKDYVLLSKDEDFVNYKDYGLKVLW